jgi:hypothetical protein
MSRKTVVASLAGAIVLGLAAFSAAQAAPVSMSQGGVYSGKASIVQQAYYRHYRYHRYHRRHWRRYWHW